MLAGVAAGLADYFDVDPTIVRIGFVALAFLGGLAVPLYLAGWLLIPDEDTDLSVAEELLARERARERATDPTTAPLPIPEPRGDSMRYRWDPAYPMGRRESQAADASMRASDDERNAVADKLSRHYAEGRLDEAEFKSRLDTAMSATTRGDLHGLFHDLPRLPSEPPPPPPRHRRILPFVLLVAFVAIVAGATMPCLPAVPRALVAASPSSASSLWRRAMGRPSWHHHHARGGRPSSVMDH